MFVLRYKKFDVRLINVLQLKNNSLCRINVINLKNNDFCPITTHESGSTVTKIHKVYGVYFESQRLHYCTKYSFGLRSIH